MNRLLSLGLASALIAFGFAGSANARGMEVQKSGGVYYKAAACAKPTPGKFRCHARIVTNSAGAAMIRQTTPSGFGPAQLRDAYKITGTGRGRTVVAIVDAFGYNDAEKDLNTYRKQFGLSKCTTANGCFKKLNQTGAQGPYPAQNVGWAQESALDIQMASAMCPKCQIWLVEATTNSFSDITTAVNTAVALGAHVVSNSYGASDFFNPGLESAYNHKGVAMTVSSGDAGFGVEFPASSPHVTAVGGTHLVTDASPRGWAETVWSGAGSGCSAFYPKPAWQADPLCPRRMVADVSAVSDPATGVAVFAPINSTTSAWLVFGGTSVAAPIIGGIYGENGGKVKFGSDPYANLGALFDVTSGSNGSCGGTYFCTGLPGYDGPTGLGTPNGDTAF